jgi:hypothetical protein
VKRSVALFVVLVFVAVGCGGGGDSYRLVTGQINIGRNCDELGEYRNILYTDIVIRDVEEELLAVMDASSNWWLTVDPVPWCLATFSARDLPKKDMYIIDTGTRGTFYVSEDEIIIEKGEAELFSLSIG